MDQAGQQGSSWGQRGLGAGSAGGGVLSTALEKPLFSRGLGNTKPQLKGKENSTTGLVPSVAAFRSAQCPGAPMLSATRPGMRLDPRGAACAGDSVYAKLQESQKSARENEEAAPAGGHPLGLWGIVTDSGSI